MTGNMSVTRIKKSQGKQFECNNYKTSDGRHNQMSKRDQKVWKMLTNSTRAQNYLYHSTADSDWYEETGQKYFTDF